MGHTPSSLQSKSLEQCRLGRLLSGSPSDRQVMAGSVQRQAQVHRRKPAVQADRGLSRLLRSKCNHDRQLMAGLRPPKDDAQRPERSECCLSSARSGVSGRTTAYRCTVQINVSFRARPPTAGLADQLTFAGSEALGSCCMHPSYAWKPASRWCLTASTSASSRTST